MRLLLISIASFVGVAALAFAADEPAVDEPAVDAGAVDEPAADAADEPPAPLAGPWDDWTADTLVRAALHDLGAPGVTRPADPESELVRQGRELVETGVTTGPDGAKTRPQSKEFVCGHCHVSVPEEATLGVFDPETRLDRAIADDLPFVPGTTLYGLVDRASWFNGDWAQRYGELVEPARRDLRAATKLCWEECSQGREPAEWELDAVIAYMEQLGLRLGDLPPPLEDLRAAARAGEGDAVRARILEASSAPAPATFDEPPKDHGRKGGYPGLTGDPERGGEVYRRSCLHCHAKGGPGTHRYADTKASWRTFLMHMPRRDHESFYEVIRHGTKPHAGAYMPQYTLERLSNQQVEDLRAYFEAGVGRRPRGAQ